MNYYFNIDICIELRFVTLRIQIWNMYAYVI